MDKLKATEVRLRKQPSGDITEMVRGETHTCAGTAEVLYPAMKAHHPIRFSIVN